MPAEIYEYQHQGDNHRENGRCLADCRSNQHIGGQLGRHGRLPGDSITGLAGRKSGADPGADCPEAHAESGPQKGSGLNQTSISGIHKQEQDGDHQGKNRRRFGHCLSHQHIFKDLSGGVRVPGNGNIGHCGRMPFANGRADGAQSHRKTASGISRQANHGLNINSHSLFYLHGYINNR